MSGLFFFASPPITKSAPQTPSLRQLPPISGPESPAARDSSPPNPKDRHPLPADVLSDSYETVRRPTGNPHHPSRTGVPDAPCSPPESRSPRSASPHPVKI